MNKYYLLLSLMTLLITGCGSSSDSAPARLQTPPPGPAPMTDVAPDSPVNHLSFAEVSQAAGVDFTHGFRSNGPSAEAMAGVAVGDYDNDGWLDLYVAQGDTGANHLYRNLGRVGELAFENVAGNAGVAMGLDDKTAGPIFVDYDGDGDDDLFVGGIEYNPVRLFQNDGKGSFSDVTVASGLSSITRENSFSPAFGDYDGDGDLDMFMPHWTFTNGELPGRSSQHLWRNGGNGTFVDVSDDSLVRAAVVAGSNDYTFTPNFADIDNDNDLDLLIVSDNNTSRVLINDGDQGGGLFTFRNITDENVITDEAGMGAAVADFDNDGDLDWFVSSISDDGTGIRTGNRYYENTGNGIFSDSTSSAGLRTGYWGWASCAADFNNDGFLDIFHVNGIGQNASSLFLDDPSRLFIANGDGSFTEYSEPLGLLDQKQGRGIVCFDGDQDGDIDIFIANNSDRPSLFRNDGGNDLNYLNIKLRSGPPNTAAIGARIYVSSAGISQMREVGLGSNYVSQNPTEQHFGLGAANFVDTVRIVWPDRSVSERATIATNQRIEISYPDSWSTDQ